LVFKKNKITCPQPIGFNPVITSWLSNYRGWSDWEFNCVCEGVQVNNDLGVMTLLNDCQILPTSIHTLNHWANSSIHPHTLTTSFWMETEGKKNPIH